MRRIRIRAGQQRVRLTVLIVAAVALASGCTADAQEPSAELPAASSTSAEPPPELPPLGPEDFPVPDEARTQDEAGAEAFLRYFVALVNSRQALVSGDGIRELGPDCTDCLAIARRFDEAGQSGYRIEGGKLSIIGEPGTAFFGDRVEFSFVADIEAVVAYDSENQVVPDSKSPAQEGLSCGLGLLWSEEQSSWLVAGLTLG